MPLILPTSWALFPIHRVILSPEGATCGCQTPGCANAGKHPASPWKGLGAGEKLPAYEDGQGYGLATGARSGCIVLDLDSKPIGHLKYPNGLSGLETLQLLGEVPNTLTVITPSGGFHLYFQAPQFPVANSVGAFGRGYGRDASNSGIDIRGDGGYVVIPDSVHKSGGVYRFLDVPDGTDPSALIAPLPDWIAARLTESPGLGGAPFPAPAFPSLNPEQAQSTEEGLQAIDRAVETLRKCKDGLRNATLFRVCAEMGDRAHVGDIRLDDARTAISTFLHMENWGDLPKTLDTMERGFIKGAAKERCMVIVGPDHEDCNDQAIVGLAKRDDIYVIGNALARDNSQGIGAVSYNNLREILASAVDWRQRSKEGELKRVHPPDWAVGEVLDRGYWDGLRLVTGFSRTPVLRPDGSVATSKGWDPITGVVLGEAWEEVPGITLEVARAFLEETFQDFPFASPSHRGALMCALLTPLAVHAFEGPIPLFFFDASVAGAGKGKLASVCGIISTGEVPATSTYKESEEEMRKYITTCAKNPKPLIFFDNVEGEFGGAVLCSVLTSADRVWNDRLLGGNTVFSGKLNSVIYATGNNATLGPDMERRVVPVRIVPEVERPELREDFRHPNLMAWVTDNLRPLTWCALALLRGYIAAGKPFEGRAWGSYEAWSRLVVGTVVWAGFDSPVGAVEAMRAGNDRLNEGAALVQALSGMGEFTAKEAHDLAYPKGTFMGGALDGGKALRALLEDTYPAPKQCTIIQLAGLLRRYKGRVFGGLSIQEKGKRHNLVSWGVGPVRSRLG